jgi:hypothetical protein
VCGRSSKTRVAKRNVFQDRFYKAYASVKGYGKHGANIGRERKYLLPHPNTICSGSFTSGLIRPSLRNRPGLKVCGSGYTDSSRDIALLNIQRVAKKDHIIRIAYHELPMTVVPAGMKSPLYTSSSITRWIEAETVFRTPPSNGTSDNCTKRSQRSPS